MTSTYGLDNWLDRHHTARDDGACTIVVAPKWADIFARAQDEMLAAAGVTDLIDIRPDEYDRRWRAALIAIGVTPA